jgi:hypothetical protein
MAFRRFGHRSVRAAFQTKETDEELEEHQPRDLYRHHHPLQDDDQHLSEDEPEGAKHEAVDRRDQLDDHQRQGGVCQRERGDTQERERVDRELKRGLEQVPEPSDDAPHPTGPG